jgi:hypothetical protein
MCSKGLFAEQESEIFQSKYVSVLTCYTFSSSHLQDGRNASQESSHNGPDVDSVPHIPSATNIQNIFSVKRSTSFLSEGNGIIPLAKLLELEKQALRPYSLSPEIHIIVRCFVHEVLCLYSTSVSGSYYCRADGVKQFNLDTFEKLESFSTDHRSPSRYLLARIWDEQLSYDSSHTYAHTTMPLFRQRLKNPFYAILLERCHDGRLRRLSTRKRIIVELEQLPPQTYGVRSLDLY